MNNKIVTLLIIFACYNVLWAATKQSKTGTLFKKIKKAIVVVKTATNEKAAKASYGSGFAISNDGLIITNYHVVSTKLNEMDGVYNIYVEAGEKTFPAKIVGFNIYQDLAILKINKKFKYPLKLRKSKLELGATVYSVGKPRDLNISIISGEYNGSVKSGAYSQYLVSTPINKGMSGGPSIDGNGQVIGVNVAVLSDGDNIAFLVPQKSVNEFIEQNINKTSFITESKQVEEEQNKQLSFVQKRFTNDLINNKKRHRLGNWEHPDLSELLKCWEINNKKHNKRLSVQKYICNMQHRSIVGSDSNQGYYLVRFAVRKNINLTYLQFNKEISQQFGNQETRKSTKTRTKLTCNSEIVNNKNGIPFKVVYCAGGYTKLKGLYRFIIAGISLHNNKEVINFTMNLKGFKRESIKTILKQTLNSIKYHNQEKM